MGHFLTGVLVGNTSNFLQQDFCFKHKHHLVQGKLGEGSNISCCLSVSGTAEWDADASQMGFLGSNVSGGRIVCLPRACWAHGASKMANLGEFLLYIFQCASLRKTCFRQTHAAETLLPPSAWFHPETFAFPPCLPKSHLCTLPYVLSCFLPARAQTIEHPLSLLTC